MDLPMQSVYGILVYMTNWKSWDPRGQIICNTHDGAIVWQVRSTHAPTPGEMTLEER